jgi:hypothetical protein
VQAGGGISSTRKPGYPTRRDSGIFLCCGYFRLDKRKERKIDPAMTLVQSPEVALPLSNIGRVSESIKGPSDLNGPTTVTVDSNISRLPEKIENIRFELEEHPVDVVRPIKVGVIGAGLAGITAGVLLPAKLPGLDLRIYDKNADVVCYCQSICCFEAHHTF